jgi:hypothetical protein
MAMPLRMPNPATINGDAASQRCAPASTWSITLTCIEPGVLPMQASKAATLPIRPSILKSYSLECRDGDESSMCEFLA